MSAGLQTSDPHDRQADIRVARGRPGGAGYITYADAADRLLDNGFEPLPIIPGEKRPAPSRWTTIELTSDRIAQWVGRFSDHGVGLRTGHLVGLDIDELDPDRAHKIHRLAEERFGDTLVRVGQWPKRLLLYRTEAMFPKMKSGKVEILGRGQQFVAFGLHGATRRPYYWTTGETPLEVCLEDLPVVDKESLAAFLAEVGEGEEHVSRRRGGAVGQAQPTGDSPLRDETGLVVDGRDAWLSQIAFHAVHDALDAGQRSAVAEIVDLVWQRFRESTALDRPRQNNTRCYEYRDAVKKVQDKLRLADEGRLPDRNSSPPEPEFDPPGLTADEGRHRLDELLDGFCDQVRLWHGKEISSLPALGVRATVGLGKSRAAREKLLSLAASLREKPLPHRLLVFTASHALAEETAEGWQQAGAHVAVMRGYERTDPLSGEPMCRDLDAVRAALSSGLRVRPSVCVGSDGTKCRFFEQCSKQQNLRDVAGADVVVAPYDALFSGLAFDKDDVALLLIDEGCWARAVDQVSDIAIDDILNAPISGMGNGSMREPIGAMADLVAFRVRLAKGLIANGPGPLARQALLDARMSAEDCQHAARLERWRMQDPDLYPGIAGEQRREAFRVAAENARILRLAGLWDALAEFMRRCGDRSGRVRVRIDDKDGRHKIDLRRVRGLHESLRGKPVLHLDATMRADLIHSILPGLLIESIDVAAPHMHVRHVHGKFGKSMLCPLQGLAEEEIKRRANRLRECVDYVRWQALRVFPKPVLVVTYQAIEEAFEKIPNVEVAHFNAVAGLDCYKHVALLISIGRPLPPSTELEALTGAYFDHVPVGRYRWDRAGIRMRGGTVRGIDVIRHEDERAETLRAAICDDELIQVIGRGRGVNRSAADPLDVHLLADVALPLVTDRLTDWALERPDIVQQMLLSGMAVDSPADAFALHPDLFASVNAAKLAFQRAGFKGQNPINRSYREMTLKSAAYRRPGRGRSWQRAWWVESTCHDARVVLESAVGPLKEWRQSR